MSDAPRPHRRGGRPPSLTRPAFADTALALPPPRPPEALVPGLRCLGVDVGANQPVSPGRPAGYNTGHRSLRNALPAECGGRVFVTPCVRCKNCLSACIFWNLHRVRAQALFCDIVYGGELSVRGGRAPPARRFGRAGASGSRGLERGRQSGPLRASV